MKRMILMVLAAAVIAVPAWAFHDDGVAHCDGCHTMHNSEDGAGVNFDLLGGPGTDPGTGYDDLLLYENASDVCLACHGGARSYNVFTDDPLDPGLSNYYSAGNFVFLLEDNLNDGHAGANNPIPGQAGGHNIPSGLKGSAWDTTLSAPPSDGSSPLQNNQIHCSSCHDPHGTGSFRLLYQAGQTIEVGGDLVPFTDTIMAYGISFGDVETDDHHNSYVSGYSGWCDACHTGFHMSGENIHPSGVSIGPIIAAKYNKYDGTTDCVNTPPTPGIPCGTGGSATSYLADVPFEDNSHDDTTTESTQGPNSNSRVACVTCHRAHATSAPNSGRWDFAVTFMDEDGLESGSWAIPHSYDGNQRSLCNKCHTQDEFDLLIVPPPAPGFDGGPEAP